MFTEKCKIADLLNGSLPTTSPGVREIEISSDYGLQPGYPQSTSYGNTAPVTITELVVREGNQQGLNLTHRSSGQRVFCPDDKIVSVTAVYMTSAPGKKLGGPIRYIVLIDPSVIQSA